MLSAFDGLALSLTEGEEVEAVTPEVFDVIFTRSLAFLQLPEEGNRRTLSRLFAARLQFIYSRHPEAAKRRHFYRLGLPLRDCERVEDSKENLLQLFLRAHDFLEWDVGDRAELLADIAELLFELDEIRPTHENPDCWRQILLLWLMGRNPSQMAADPIVAACKLSSQQVSRWIDDVCAYRLPWGYNMLSIHMKEVAIQSDLELSSVSDYFSALVKYGVHEPVACWLLNIGVRSRLTALRVVPLIPPDLTEPNIFLEWLKADGVKELAEAGLDSDALEELRDAVQALNSTSARATRLSTTLKIMIPATAPEIAAGSHVLIRSIEAESCRKVQVHTLRGEYVGLYQISDADETLWQLLKEVESVTTTVTSLGEWEGSPFCEVLVAAV